MNQEKYDRNEGQNQGEIERDQWHEIKEGHEEHEREEGYKRILGNMEHCFGNKDFCSGNAELCAVMNTGQWRILGNKNYSFGNEEFIRDCWVVHSIAWEPGPLEMRLLKLESGIQHPKYGCLRTDAFASKDECLILLITISRR